MTWRPFGINRRERSVAAVLVAVALVIPLSVAAPASATPSPNPLQTVVVQMTSSTVSAASVVGAVSTSTPVAAAQRRYILHVPADQVPAVLARLRADHRVVYASVAQPVHATASPNDTCYTTGCPAEGASGLVMQNYLKSIGAPAAWNVTHGDGVTVAVLDSGVDATHPDLDGSTGGGNKIVGQVTVCAGCGPGDGNGHGTHVTGILAADTGNGLGVASLGWGVRVQMYKVLDSNGVGNTADVASAIYMAVAAHVPRDQHVIGELLVCR